MRKLLLALALVLGATPAFSQSYLTYTQSSGTITAGNTFQTVIAASINRKFCLIQNTSTHTMSVYVGTIGDASALKSFQVAANGGTWSCNYGDFVVLGTVSITTSTTSDPFVVAYAQ